MEYRVIGVVKIVCSVEGGAAEKNYIVPLDLKIYVLETDMLTINASVVEYILFHLPFNKVGGGHQYEVVSVPILARVKISNGSNGKILGGYLIILYHKLRQVSGKVHQS